mmetsp:Transcript_70047/g.146047  ORF Transcript_70047/g.146047 Transcript_70047/m.146047 type:complete len:223 (+) Transcript_70047:116-784(+)
MADFEKSRAGSRLGESRIPLSFQKVVTAPDGSPDFKADRTVPPSDVAEELQHNMQEYMENVSNEMKMATKLKKAIDDVAAVVENGAAFNREVSGASVVDMQMLLYNTRNMLKTKDKYMNSYKLDNNEQQTTARRLRNAMNDQIHNPRITADAGTRRTSASPSRTTVHTHEHTHTSSRMGDTQGSRMGGHSPWSPMPHSPEEELQMLRRRVQELEAALAAKHH